MKQLTIPATVDNLPFSDYLDRVVWPLAYWRNSGHEVLTCAMSMREKVKAAVSGGSVELTNREHEELCTKIGVPEMTMMAPELLNAAWTYSLAVVTAKNA